MPAKTTAKPAQKVTVIPPTSRRVKKIDRDKAAINEAAKLGPEAAEAKAKQISSGKKLNAQAMGFPAVYLGPGGKFRPGMDARAKSDMIAAVVGRPNKYALHTWDPKEAERLIKARGWDGYLSAARKKILAKAKAATAKAA